MARRILCIEAAPAGWKPSEPTPLSGWGTQAQKSVEHAGHAAHALASGRWEKRHRLFETLLSGESEDSAADNKNSKAAAAAEDDDSVLRTGTKKTKKEVEAAEKALGFGSGQLRKDDQALKADHYGVLGLKDKRWAASDAEVRKAYRKLILKHHPDKAKALESGGDLDAAEEEDAAFKAIQLAYETLSHPKRRVVYDSYWLGREFKDTVPVADSVSAGEFFQVYGAVFDRFAVWSVKQPVPRLGDKDTPIEKVDEFYNWWDSFESWRNYGYDDEFAVAEAEGRDERRWMERKNETERAKRKREERSRINGLVDAAYAADPRIAQAKADKKEAKKAARAARHAELNAAKEAELARLEQEAAEAEKAKMEEAAQAAVEKEKARAAKEAAKAVLKAARIRLRNAAEKMFQYKSGLGAVKAEDVELMCTSHKDPAPLNAICDELDNGSGKAFTDTLATIRADLAAAAAGPAGAGSEKKSSSAAKKSESKYPPWTEEELAALAKAVSKVPGGTRNRWQVMADYIGTGRSAEDVLAKVKSVDWNDKGASGLAKGNSSEYYAAAMGKRGAKVDVKSGLTQRWEFEGLDHSEVAAANQRIRDADAAAEEGDPALVDGMLPALGALPANPIWDAASHSAMEAALNKFPHDLPEAERWDKVCSSIPGKKKKAILARYKEICDYREAVAAGKSNLTNIAAAAQAGAITTRSGDDMTEEERAAQVEKVGGVKKTMRLNLSSAWSEGQQRSFEMALRLYPKQLGLMRWDKIAESVPGKSKAQLIARYQEVRNAALAASQ